MPRAVGTDRGPIVCVRGIAPGPNNENAHANLGSRTRDYARASVRTGFPGITDDEAERRVDLRLARFSAGGAVPLTGWGIGGERRAGGVWL